MYLQLTQPARSRKTSQVSANQQPLFDDSAFTRDAGLAVKGVMTIESLPTLAIEDVYAKEAAWRDIQQTHIARWRRLADLWVSAWFGNEMSAAEYRALADRLQGRDSLLSDAQAERFLAHPAVTNNDYFHWELAFPEVFFDEYGRSLKDAAGFDAVIGNPPYIRQETLGVETKNFYNARFRNVFHGIADIYVYFIGSGIQLLKKNASLGYITSGVFRKLNYGAPLRAFLATHTTLRQIVDFGDEQVFSGAVTYPIIIITERRKPTKNDRLSFHSSQVFSDRGEVGQLCLLPQGDESWNFLDERLNHIINGWEDSRKLGSILNGDIYRGLTTGLNDAFVIDKETLTHLQLPKKAVSEKLIKPYLRGEDLKTWIVADAGLQVIVFPSGWTREKYGEGLSEGEAWNHICRDYPALASHLSKFSEQARKRYDQGEYWWELRPCSYYPVFEQPRILSTKVSLEPTFSYSEQVIYPANTSYVLPVPSKTEGLFLLSILNSRISKFYSRNVFAPKANGYYEVQPGKLSDFPIPEVTSSTNEYTAVVATAKTHYEQGNHPAILDWTAAELAASRNDAIHDLLAFLAEQMIAMNKEKQVKLEAFWLDLEGGSDAQTFAVLRRKGKQQASLHKAVPAAQSFVSAASRSRVALDASLSWNEEAFKGFVKLLVKKVPHLSDIVQVYRQHAPGVAALTLRLAATDRLIDQIVTQLYGLTAEEIAIVEGAA